MKVVQSERKTFVIHEAVSPSFEGFDFVVDAFDHGAGDWVLEVVEQAGPIPGEGFGDFGRLFDSGPKRVRTPGLREGPCSGKIFLFPKEPGLFLPRMDSEERPVGLKQSIESGLPARPQVLIVGQQEEPVPLEDPLPRRIKFPLLFSAQVPRSPGS